MDLGNYGIGGNEVKIDASEGIAEIPQNRTLLVEQLTKDEPVAPEVIAGLTNIDEVFAHFRPEIDIEFSDAEGAPVEENFRFQNVGDFSVKKMTEQSPFLDGRSVPVGDSGCFLFYILKISHHVRCVQEYS